MKAAMTRLRAQALENNDDALFEIIRRCDRYEIIRTLNPQQFAELYRRNIAGEGRFDDMVDAIWLDRMTRGG